jgi:hypothetical protein
MFNRERSFKKSANTENRVPPQHKLDMDSNKKKRKIVGWGYEDEQPSLTITQNILTLLKTAWQIQDFEPLPQADLRKVAAELRKPRFTLTKKIRKFCTDDAEERMRHSYGQAFRLVIV